MKNILLGTAAFLLVAMVANSAQAGWRYYRWRPLAPVAPVVVRPAYVAPVYVARPVYVAPPVMVPPIVVPQRVYHYGGYYGPTSVQVRSGSYYYPGRVQVHTPGVGLSISF